MRFLEHPEDFYQVHDELIRLLSFHPDIAPPNALPRDPAAPHLLDALTSARLHFEALQADGLKECTRILGTTFDPNDAAARAKLIASVAPALGLLDTDNLGRLASAARLGALGKMTREEVIRAERLVATLRQQAGELARLAEEPGRFRRQRLYSRVAGWLKEVPSAERKVDHCPVCGTSLTDRCDEVTGKPVTNHLQDCLNDTDQTHLEKTARDWEAAAVGQLRAGLPWPVQRELDERLPQHPIDLITKALSAELFEAGVFSGPLSPLKSVATALCEFEASRAPSLVEPARRPLPAIFAPHKGLDEVLSRAERALAFARWRRENLNYIRGAMSRIVGYQPTDTHDSGVASPETAVPIAPQLRTLNSIVQSIAPLVEALNKTRHLTKLASDRQRQAERVAQYESVAAALEPITWLGTAVQKLVWQLTTELMDATKEWKGRLYVPSTVGAPVVATAQVHSDGRLLMQSESAGVRAPAQDVSNASELRASLLAFFLAFRTHILKRRGGLSLLLLDDVHELFDGYNRRRLASAISHLAVNGSRVVVATNETTFGRQLCTIAGERGPEIVTRRQIHTLSSFRDCIHLGEFAEEVERKRHAFEANENDDQKARDYLKDFRIFLENRLLDFFDVAAPGMPDRPTLSNLLDGLRSWRAAGQEPFVNHVWGKLLNDQSLAHSSQFIKLVNAVHHGQEREVTYADVAGLADDCRRLLSSLEDTHVDYERWMRRDGRSLLAATQPAAPKPVSLPRLDAPIISDLAAFSNELAALEGQESGERLGADMLQSCAMYIVRCHNFGFAAPANCRVLVDTSEQDVSDNRLVIALHGHKVYARRLLKTQYPTSIIALGSEAQNPLARPPSLMLPAAEVRLLKVVGVLFDSRAPDRSREEAVLAIEEPFPDGVELAFRVSGESALPLALPGQIVLGGARVSPTSLDRHKGAILAIDSSEGSFLKRVGDPLPGLPHVRTFHSVGGMGESVVLCTEEVEDALPQSRLPFIRSARLVLGVLYGRQ